MKRETWTMSKQHCLVFPEATMWLKDWEHIIFFFLTESEFRLFCLESCVRRHWKWQWSIYHKNYRKYKFTFCVSVRFQPSDTLFMTKCIFCDYQIQAISVYLILQVFPNIDWQWCSGFCSLVQSFIELTYTFSNIYILYVRSWNVKAMSCVIPKQWIMNNDTLDIPVDWTLQLFCMCS